GWVCAWAPGYMVGKLPRGHAEGTVEADRLAVDVVVADDLLHQAGEVGRVAEALGEGDAVGQRLALRLGHEPEQGRVEDARSDGDHADTGRRQVARRRQGEADDARLRRGVGDLADLAVE